MQLDLLQATASGTRAKDIAAGQCFERKGKYYMRVKPVSFLLNSTLVSDALYSAKVFVVDIKAGTIFIIHGMEEVTKVDARVSVFK